MPSALVAIAAKEFAENVHSRRFQIALALGTLLMVTSTLTLAISYQEDEAAFQVAQSDLSQSRGDLSGFNQVALEIAEVIRRPNPLSVFASGPGDDYRRDAETGGFGPTAQSSGGSGSPTNQRFEALDLGFVAVVVMTFMAVLFAYDAISGERERGTLKLMLANPVPRDTVLLGKYLGGMASVLLPFGLSLLVGLAVFQATGVHLDGDEWLRLGLVVLLFLPLASAFYLLGLLVSSVARRSSTSLLALLLVWLVLVFGAGNVAAAVAKSTTDVTSDAEVLEEFMAIREEEQRRSDALNQEMFQYFGQPNATQDPAVQAKIQELQKEQQEVFKESQAKRDALLEQSRRGLDAQLQAAEALAAVSPAEAFRNLATALAQTDYWSYKHAREAADAYQREAERAREAWSEEQGMTSWGGGGIRYVVRAGPGGAIEAPGNTFEPPEFEYASPDVGDQLGKGLRDLAVLLGYNLVAFVGAWVAFTRYDVR